MPKQTRCAFVVIKLLIGGEPWFLMRRDSDWKDVNLIGGHETEKDGGRLDKAARRELLEEVPALRRINSCELEPVTEEVKYGPVFSRSAHREVRYIIQFFLLVFSRTPAFLLESLRGSTLNILIRQRDLFDQRKHRISAFVHVLDASLPGGLKSIPYSWVEDLAGEAAAKSLLSEQQTELALD